MDPSVQYYNPEEYLETASGNKICKKSIIKGQEQISLKGKVIMKQSLIIRGDLAVISLGRYVVIQDYVTLKPSYKTQKQKVQFIPLHIGDYVIIEQGCTISASKIGSYVQIGKNCLISHRAIIGDNVIIMDDSIVPPDTQIPAYCVYGGRPAVYINELPETSQYIFKEKAQNYYKYQFLPSVEKK